nr:hypothetical protein CFP56_31629 [Quercus suber]
MARFAFRPSRFFRRTTSAQTDREITSTTTSTSTSTSTSISTSTVSKSALGSLASRSVSQLQRPSPTSSATEPIFADQDAASTRADDGEGIAREEPHLVDSVAALSRKTSDSQADDRTLGGSELELNLDHKIEPSPVTAPVPAVTIEQPTPDAAVTQQETVSEIQYVYNAPLPALTAP